MTDNEKKLIDISAVKEFAEWAGDRDLATIYKECPRADWFLFFVKKSLLYKVNIRKYVSLKIICAKNVLDWMSDVSTNAMVTAKEFVDNDWAVAMGNKKELIRKFADLDCYLTKEEVKELLVDGIDPWDRYVISKKATMRAFSDGIAHDTLCLESESKDWRFAEYVARVLAMAKSNSTKEENELKPDIHLRLVDQMRKSISFADILTGGK